MFKINTFPNKRDALLHLEMQVRILNINPIFLIILNFELPEYSKLKFNIENSFMV